LGDLRCVSQFKMHKRVVERLSGGRFPVGRRRPYVQSARWGGLNAALMDAADIAWKPALVVRGAAKPSLLDGYAIERGLADRHVLEVSDEVHRLVTGLVAMCTGCVLSLPPGDPAENLAGVRKQVDARCFICRKSARRSGPRRNG